jgi:hypothetical protein
MRYSEPAFDSLSADEQRLQQQQQLLSAARSGTPVGGTLPGCQVVDLKQWKEAICQCTRTAKFKALHSVAAPRQRLIVVYQFQLIQTRMHVEI